VDRPGPEHPRWVTRPYLWLSSSSLDSWEQCTTARFRSLSLGCTMSLHLRRSPPFAIGLTARASRRGSGEPDRPGAYGQASRALAAGISIGSGAASRRYPEIRRRGYLRQPGRRARLWGRRRASPAWRWLPSRARGCRSQFTQYYAEGASPLCNRKGPGIEPGLFVPLANTRTATTLRAVGFPSSSPS
jgi:hypothetical protein